MLSICSGQAAALAGGTTFHIDFALPVDGDISKGLKRYQDVSKRAVMDYSFHMAITTWNDKVLSFPSEMTHSEIDDIGNTLTQYTWAAMLRITSSFKLGLPLTLG